jgi:predicted enzyme related to lactoylglutathione lyase
MPRSVVIASVLTALLYGVAAVPQSRSPRAADRMLAVPGEFVWHDLVTDDPSASRAFYGSLFGWTFDTGDGVDPRYTIIKHNGVPIGGIVRSDPTPGTDFIAQWLAYVVVGDLDGSVRVFRQQGGRVIREPRKLHKQLRVAVVADPQGAPLGLASGGPRFETATPPGLHRWLWMDYVARDAAAALTFYGASVGFRHQVSDTRQNFTYYVLQTDRPRAGLFRSPWRRETSAWLPYVRVADPGLMAAAAEELGATIAVAPQASVRNGSLAIIVDPTGAPLALQKFPFEDGGAQ